MDVNASDKPRGADESHPPADDVAWLPRARLRSGGRGDRLLTTLLILTAGVMAMAAAVAAYARHGDLIKFDLASLQVFSGERKAPDRAAPAAIEPPPPTVRTVSPAPPRPAPSAAQPEPAPAPAPLPAEQTRRSVERVMPDGSPAPTPEAPRAPPVEPPAAPQPAAPEPGRVAAAPEPANLMPQRPVIIQPPPEVFEPVPPIPSSGAPALPAPSTAFAPPPPPLVAESQASAPAATRAPAREPAPEPRQSVAVAGAQPAAPAREAAVPAPAGGRVAIYLDEFDDQKAAAAGLTQKQGAYAPLIGSAGRLTYSRRLGNTWRLRVTNLDQATAEALCAKLKGAGAPCAVGPN